MAQKKRYAQVGLGGRSMMFSDAVIDTFADHCEMVGFCDNNPGRLQLRIDTVRDKAGEVPGYDAKDFDRMLAETKPDCVIVTTKDCHHDEYVCRAMELGCDVVTEKPMTTDAAKCQRIIDTQAKTGKTCTVTFNYRYSPPRTQIKDLLMSGVIGEVLSVEFQWLLDTHHGADYYRRWHRTKANSGGLMVHKATHHFDLVNWWLSSVPESVGAMGHRRFYVPSTADRMGLTQRGERCHGCAHLAECPFALDLAANEKLKALYLDQEQYDGYHRDCCVFSDQIDIEDSMNLVVGYANGVKMSYALNSFMPWEGYQVAFSGTKGRLEHKCQETVYINADGSVPGALKKDGTSTRIFPQRGDAYQVDLWEAKGGHGGGDSPLLTDIFGKDPEPDKYLRAADHRSGAYSILTGVAANVSMAESRMVRIDELVTGIAMPDYPAMPDGSEPLEIPKRKRAD